MIPNNRLSTNKHISAFSGSRSVPAFTLLSDKETANTPIDQWNYIPQDWIGLSNGSSIVLSSEGQSDIVVLETPNITEFSFTFDQNKRPVVSYVSAGVAKLYWYDTLQSANVTSILGSTVYSPKVSLDDKHRLASATNDVILAYIKNGDLKYRQQRDRYQTEYTLATLTPNTRLRRIGMNELNRFQFEYYEMFDPSISELK